jgi:hypothetical protein
MTRCTPYSLGVWQVVAATFLLFTNIGVHADDPWSYTVHFPSGGTLVGDVVNESSVAGRNLFVFKSQSGSVWKLDQKKSVQKIERPDELHDRYASEAAKQADSPDGHWSMYDWCKNNGGSAKFSREMKLHLRQIVRLDPSDAKAWRFLGYIDVGGQWVPEEQFYLETGYVKLKRRWIPRALLQVDQDRSTVDDHLGARKKALKQWEKNVLRKQPADAARSELVKILDAASLEYFAENFLEKENDPALRLFFVDALGEIPNPISTAILVRRAMEDSDRSVREQALAMLDRDGFDTRNTLRSLYPYLKHPDNQLVNHAATLIGHYRDRQSIALLIESLRTVHKVSTGSEPGRMSVNTSGGLTMNTGPSTIDAQFTNKSVLQALNDITEEDFGFDVDRWKMWYSSQNTLTRFDVRTTEN